MWSMIFFAINYGSPPILIVGQELWLSGPLFKLVLNCDILINIKIMSDTLTPM